MKTLALLLTLAQQDALVAVVQQAKQWTSVYARVDGLNISEGQQRVNVYGSRSGDRYNFNGWIGNESVFLSGDKRGLWGGGLTLSLFQSGDWWHVSGTYNFTLSKFGDGWTVSGLPGGSLNVMKMGTGYVVQGSLSQDPAKTVAAVGAVVAVISGAK